MSRSLCIEHAGATLLHGCSLTPLKACKTAIWHWFCLPLMRPCGNRKRAGMSLDISLQQGCYCTSRCGLHMCSSIHNNISQKYASLDPCQSSNSERNARARQMCLTLLFLSNKVFVNTCPVRELSNLTLWHAPAFCFSTSVLG